MKLRPIHEKSKRNDTYRNKGKRGRASSKKGRKVDVVRRLAQTPLTHSAEGVGDDGAIFTEEMDTSRLSRMLCRWHDLSRGDLEAAFGDGSAMVALYEKDPQAVAYLGLCYDINSPYVRSYHDVTERKDMLCSRLKVPQQRRQGLTMLADMDVARALVELLMRLHKRKWTMLVAYEEMMYRTVALTMRVRERDLDASGKQMVEWLNASMKALGSAHDMMSKIDELMVDVTAGDAVAMQRVEDVPDYSAEFMARVLTVFHDRTEEE